MAAEGASLRLVEGSNAMRSLEQKILAYASEREGGFAGVLKSAADAEFAQVCRRCVVARAPQSASPDTPPRECVQPMLHAHVEAVSVLPGTDDGLLDASSLLQSGPCLLSDSTRPVLPPARAFSHTPARPGLRASCADKALDELEPMIAADVEAIQRIRGFAQQAHGWLLWVYAYRALDRTVDKESEARKQNTRDQYVQTRAMIEPVVRELQKMLEFTTSVRTAIVREVQTLLEQRKGNQWWNEDRLWALAELLDRLLVLDLLKDPKSAINNDFAAWRRAVQALKDPSQPRLPDLEHSLALVMDQDLYQFVSNKSSVMKSLQDALFLVRLDKDSGGIVAAHLMRLCLQVCAGPQESADFAAAAYVGKRQVAHRMLAWSVVMLGETPDEINNMSQGKGQFKEAKGGMQCDTPKVWKGAMEFLAQRAAVAVFGDMTTEVLSIMSLHPAAQEVAGKNGIVAIDDLKPDKHAKMVEGYALAPKLDGARRRYYAACLQVEEARAHLQVAADTAEYLQAPAPPKLAKDAEIFANVVGWVLLLGEWQGWVLEHAAWKYCVPAAGGVEEGADAAAGGDGGWQQYRRVVADNYSAEDKEALLELMCMIKKLAAEVLALASEVAPLLARHAHWSVQELVLGTVAGFMLKTQSRGKTAMSALLLRLQQAAADWEGQRSREPMVPLEEANGGVKMAMRESAASPALLLIMRSLVLKVRQRAAQNQGGYITKGELSLEKAGKLHDWCVGSYTHQLALNLSSCVHAVSDLSQLYFRELYLDMTKQVQFKLDLNLPHILASHVLSHRPAAASAADRGAAAGAAVNAGVAQGARGTARGRQAEMNARNVELSLVPLSIYDDAAAYALRHVQRRHMLLEIEAEAVLCLEDVLDQLAIFLYRFCRCLSSVVSSLSLSLSLSLCVCV